MLDLMRQNASGWIVKILFGIIIVVFVFAFGMSSFNDRGDPILAYVNEEPLSRKEFEEAYARYTESLRRSQPNITAEQLGSPAIKQMVFNELVNRILLLDEAEKLGVTASDREVAQGIASIPAFWNAKRQFDKNVYQAALNAQRMRPAEFERQFRVSLIVDKLHSAVAATAQADPQQARQIYNWVRETATLRYLPFRYEDYTAKIAVDDAQIKKYYEEHKKERFTRPAMSTFEMIAFTPQALAPFQTVTDEEAKAYYDASPAEFTQPGQVKARHILIGLDKNASDEDIAAARKKAEEARKRATSGEDFGKLAMLYSDGPSAGKGGELGWFPRGVMDKSFENAAFALKKGELSQPVKTPFGWHIIKVEDRREPKQLSFEDVQDRIKTRLAQDKASDQVSDLLDQAMDRLVSGMSIKDIASELGILSNTTQPLPKQAMVQYLGMTPEAAEILFKLPKGESLKTPLGVKDGYILARKIDDIEPRPIPLDDVRERIVSQLKQEGAAAMAKADAEAALKALTGPQADKGLAKYKSRIVVSDPFDRRGPIPDVGGTAELVKAVFAGKAGEWLPKVYSVEDAYLVAAQDHLIPAPDKEWNSDKERWIDTASRKYGSEMFQSFITKLRKDSDVEIVRPDLLN